LDMAARASVPGSPAATNLDMRRYVVAPIRTVNRAPTSSASLRRTRSRRVT
jgi:hypothetical protein